MAKTYRPYRPEQGFLLPPSLRDWLPERHLAYFVSDLVDQLDLSEITKVYEEEDRGYPPYHPLMMTKVLVYAYCVASFRRAELSGGWPKISRSACSRPATSQTFARSRTFARRTSRR